MSQAELPLVVHFSPCYVDLCGETGGVANVVRHICMGLRKQGADVMLVCGDSELGERKGVPGTRISPEGVMVHVIPQGGFPLVGSVGRIRKIISGLSGHVVCHVHSCFSAFTESAMIALSRQGVPFVFTPHGKLSAASLRNHEGLKAFWWRVIGGRAVSGASRIVLCSRSEAETFPRLNLSSRFDVVPNGFDYESGPLSFEQEERLLESPYILFLGYVDPRKQPEFLVRAFAMTKAKDTHKLVIAGPDPYHYLNVVEREIEKAGLGQKVILYGPAYGSEKWRLLRHAACLCLPSKGEGMPVVLSEGLGSGLPLIISRECNFEEAVGAGAAVIPEPFKEDQWALVMDSICLSEKRRERMAAEALRFSIRFRWENLIAEWVDIYASAAVSRYKGGKSHGGL
jgi:glycosyltransferase involved in cell wall biosynthesis